MPSAKGAPRQAGPEVTILRMKNIAMSSTGYATRGMLSVDILAPHCAIALFALTRGAVTVWVNGEMSGHKWALTQEEGLRDFGTRRAELRHEGPVGLRHLK